MYSLFNNPEAPSFAAGLMDDGRLWCPVCKTFDPDVVEDHKQGDTICRECSTVLAERMIDEHSEWRTIADNQGDDDPSRVGSAGNPLLENANLSTMISRAEGGAAAANLGKWQARSSLKSSDRNLVNAFKDIARMADRLGLLQVVIDRANELYKEVDETKALRGRTTKSVIAACLYIACRCHGVPRTFNEICGATSANRKDIARTYKFISKVLERNLHTISSEDFMVRFASNLRLSPEVTNTATHIAREAKQLLGIAGKSPISIAASAIYMASNLSKDPEQRKTPKDVSPATGVSEVTIRSAYKEMLPHAEKLLPPGFANPEMVRFLPQS
eukprot:TRINITY_DN13912_c0_g1_i1.p1 TRINITY_DN13912_c0_g1~~TRINITY_DN13912_c0_g1_i1.p1  ORF type:complete len:330 (-),score=62.70 TRINITY_DN13912_c0_g1_i1:9-998(-)